MHKHLLAAVLSLAVAMTGASALEAHAKTTFVTIGTGGITGVYSTNRLVPYILLRIAMKWMQLMSTMLHSIN